MFWTAEQEFVQQVTLSWVRRSRPVLDEGDIPHDEMDVEEERLTIENVTWRQRDGSHYLQYANPAENGDAQSSGRTTLRMEPHQLTLIRFGDIVWNQTFRKGAASASILRTPYANLDVEVETAELDISVTEQGGAIHCDYILTLGGIPQQVSLEISFLRN